MTVVRDLLPLSEKLRKAHSRFFSSSFLLTGVRKITLEKDTCKIYEKTPLDQDEKARDKQNLFELKTA